MYTYAISDGATEIYIGAPPQRILTADNATRIDYIRFILSMKQYIVENINRRISEINNYPDKLSAFIGSIRQIVDTKETKD
jgi:hypothetical protein